MSFATTAFTAVSSAAPAKAQGKGLMARVLEALVESRRQQAQREIARHQRMIDEITKRSAVKVARGDLPF